MKNKLLALMALCGAIIYHALVGIRELAGSGLVFHRS